MAPTRGAIHLIADRIVLIRDRKHLTSDHIHPTGGGIDPTHSETTPRKSVRVSRNSHTVLICGLIGASIEQITSAADRNVRRPARMNAILDQIDVIQDHILPTHRGIDFISDRIDLMVCRSRVIN